MSAQEKPLAEVTGTYQFDHLMTSEDGVSASLNVSRGWDGSVNIPILPWFGVVGAAGSIWKSESTSGTISASGTASVFTYGGGPQLTYRKSNIHPFARFLVGDAHSSASGSVNSVLGSFSSSGSVDSFFIAPGGGADFRITHNVWLRGGADYLRTSKFGETVNDIRAFAGITFTFGEAEESPHAQEPSNNSSPRRLPDSGMNIASLGIRVVAEERTGVRIESVEAGSTAGKAGLHPGDVINAVDGASIKTPADLATQLSSRVAGDKVRVSYLLHGQWQAEVIITLTEGR
jgi:hypothetical protein